MVYRVAGPIQFICFYRFRFSSASLCRPHLSACLHALSSCCCHSYHFAIMTFFILSSTPPAERFYRLHFPVCQFLCGI